MLDFERKVGEAFEITHLDVNVRATRLKPRWGWDEGAHAKHCFARILPLLARWFTVGRCVWGNHDNLAEMPASARGRG